MKKIPASWVQRFIGVPDEVAICHGYDVARKTLDVFFEKGKLVQVALDINNNEIDRQTSEYFEHKYFIEQVKRWYASSIHPRLTLLSETFGFDLPWTTGGKAEWEHDPTTPLPVLITPESADLAKSVLNPFMDSSLYTDYQKEDGWTDAAFAQLLEELDTTNKDVTT